MGLDSGYTHFAIIHEQGYGDYKTFNYEGKSLSTWWTYWSSAENAIGNWDYTGLGYFNAPLEGLEYTRVTLRGYSFY